MLLSNILASDVFHGTWEPNILAITGECLWSGEVHFTLIAIQFSSTVLKRYASWESSDSHLLSVSNRSNKIWPYAGNSEYLQVRASVKILKCGQSAGKTCILESGKGVGY